MRDMLTLLACLLLFVFGVVPTYADKNYVTNLDDLNNNDIKFVALDSTVPLLVPVHQDKSLFMLFPEEISVISGAGFIQLDRLLSAPKGIRYAAEYTISMDESRDSLTVQLMDSIRPPIPVRTLIVRLVSGSVYSYKIVPIPNISEAWSVINFAPEPVGDGLTRVDAVAERAGTAATADDSSTLESPQYEEPPLVEILEDSARAEYIPPTEERLIGYYDLLKALLLFESSAAKQAIIDDSKYVTGYSDTPQSADYGVYEIQINQILRAQSMDLTVLDISILNKSEVEMVINPNRCSLHVGSMTFWAKGYSLPAVVPAKNAVRGYLAFYQNGDSSRNNLAINNRYRVNVDVVNVERDGPIE